MNKVKRVALSAGALAAVALLVGIVACKEESKSAPPPPPAPAAAPAPSAAPAAPAAAPAAGAPAAAPAAAAPQAGAGTIEGAVLYTGAPVTMKPLAMGADPKCPKGQNDESVLVKGGKLENVWVRVTKAASGSLPAGTPSAQSIMVTQHGCMYRPRMQFAQVGEKIVVKNEDDTLHNVHTFLGASTAFNKAMPGKAAAPIEYAPTEEGMIKWKCDVHPWMRGFVGVAKTNLQATTGDSGDFKIENVPAGKYTLEAWHEKFGPKTAEVTVEAGKPAKVEFKYDGTEKGS
jgi:plastocyanin